MRTTVNIDEHLLAEIKVAAARSHRTIGSVMEDALRTFLATRPEASSIDTFRLPSFEGGGLLPGVDLDDKEQLAEILADNEPPRGTR